MRINNAYKAITKLLIVTLFTALFSLINISQPASAALFGTGYVAAGAGGSGGDTTHGPVYCSANMAAVGVGLTVNGNSPGFGIYCRALGADGQLVAQDQSSVSNTTAVGGGTNKVFCPAGKVLTGFSFIIWSNVGIRCSEPPALSTQDSLIWYSATTATSYSSNCSTGGIVTGFWWRTGAWTDAIGAYCNPFAVNTLSYNVNGGSGTAPASQNAPVTNQVLTISNTYSGTKSNFHYLGWNDLANGSGNDYVPGTSETITSATNLYAKWGSYINYDGNGNSSGTAPSRQEATTTAANTELAMNTGNLAKTNYTFAGWNTAANGTGTSYPSYGVPALPANPYMQFDADHYDAATKTWADISGNSRNITSTAIRGAPSIVNYSSDINGATGTFKAVAGGTSDGVQIKNSALPSYTFCHVSRYSGTNRLRIFAGTTGNWLSGYWNGNAGVAYHEGWITSSVGTNDTNWRIQCDTGSSATANSALRSNGNLKSSVSTNMNGLPANISINLQGSVTAPTDTSDWEVAEFVIYDSVLSNSQINEIESVLRQKYGVKGLNSDIYTWNYTSTGDVTLYAQWNSAITYNGNGNTSGTAPASQTAIGQKNLTLATNSGTLAKTGFTFGGWNSAADGSGTKYAAGLTTFVSSGNATLYAQWNSTITYNANTATSGTIPTATSAISAYSNTTLASNTGSLAKTGYTFNGWNTAANGTGTHYDAGITNYQSAGSATLYAEWTSGITYNSNSADSGTAPATQNITGAGTSVTLATNSGSLTRTGFTFAGWNTTASGSGTTYAVGASYTIAGAITLYAKWTSVITFNNNSSTSGAPSVTSVTAIGSTNTTLASQSNLARTGYTFNGWNTAADGSGTNYVGGLTTYVSSGNITLYANWGLIATGVITTVTGTYGNSQVALTWSVPATVSGAGAVTDYTIQYSTDNTNWTTFSHSASITRAITVTGLTNGTPYYFRVAGYNGTNGPFATSATVTPMRVPDAPTSVLVSHTDAGAATSALVNVSWTAPSNNGGSAITNYQWSIDGTTWQNFKEGTVTGTSGTAFGLAFSTSYSIYVRAVNIVGGGAASLASTPITVNIDSCQPRTITVAGNTTYFFDKPGVCSYQFTSTSAKFAIAGASGGAGSSTYDGAGQGGRTTGTFTPAISTTYYFYIGEAGQNFSTSLTSNSTTINTRPGGFNGGGAGGGAGTNAGASGGGATDIRTTTQLNSRLVVAGGGGGYSGSYGNSCCGTGGYGSNGGGLTGGSHAPNNDFAMASAGTQSAGGNQSGGLGAGGAGGSNYLAYQGAGGGGGGYYGGGGGYITNGCGTANGCWPSGGAGGSSYPAASNSLVATYTHYQGGNCGNGYIAITYDGSAPTELTNGCGATTAPTLSTATINTYGNVITLTYNRALSAIIPDKSQFVVTVNGTSVTINSVAQGSPNTTILLTLANYVPTNSVVRVSYTDTSNYNDYIALQDSNGFDAASFVNQTIVTSGVVNPHTVTFVANGGTGTMNAQVANSATALTANAFTRRAYTFAGWNTNANGTGTNYANSVSFPFTTDLTIYAKWAAATFTVTYNYNSGSGTPASASYTGGNTALILPTPTRTGYTFAGWYTAATGGTLIGAAGTSWIPDATQTIYAQWTANTYSITYNISSATNNPTAIAQQSYTTGGSTLTLNSGSTLTRTPWYFGGWNTASDGTGTHYNASQSSVSVTTNITLYPEWVEAFEAPGPQTGVKVTLLSDNSNVTTLTTNAKMFTGAIGGVAWTSGYWIYGSSSTIGYKLTFPAPTTNFSFKYYSGSGTVLTITFTDNTTATGTLNTTNDACSGTNCYLYSYVAPAGKYIKSYQTPNNFSLYVDNLLYITLPTITFDANLGSGTMNAQSSATAANINSNAYTRTGYTFTGWNTAANGTGTSFNDGANFAFTSSVTLYAQWSGNSYAISFNGNGNSGGTVPANGSFTTGGLNYSIAANSGSLVKTGYTFSKWNTKADGTGTDYSPSATYNTTAPLVLYAKWIADTYTVTYSANGATGAPSKTSDSYTYGSTGLTLPTINTMVKTGYTFMGWIKSGDTSTVTAPYIPTASVTLNAYWIGETYSVDFNANGGTGSVNGTSYQNGATGITLPNGATLSRTGYDFAGWVTSANGTSAVISPYTTNANVTLYAKWVIKSVTVTYSAGLIDGTAPTVSLPSNTTSTYGAQFQLGNTDSITSLSGTNYAFMGWSDSSTVFSSGANYPIGLSNVVFTAQWIAIYTLHYNLNGGTGTVDPDFTYTSGTVKTTPANDLTRTGYDFLGWEDQSGLITQKNSSYTILDGHYILSAKWNIQTKKVTYGAGTGSGSVPADTTVNYGSVATLASGSGITAPAQSIFDGWLIGGVKYGAGSTLLLTADLNAVAQWKNNYFSIYFDSNGGSSNPAALNGATGSSLTLPTNPTRNGYVFAGWNAGGTVLATTTTSATIGSASSTYLATWTLAAPEAPSISAVTPSDSAATIAVTPGNGGAPSSYVVTANPGGATCSIYAPSTSCVISPLTNGTSYTFTSTAVNGSGTSSPSAPSSATTISAAPDAPGSVVATAGLNQVSLAFAAPNGNGAAVSGYTVIATPVGGGSATTFTINSGTTPVTISPLNNGTAYTFTVSAINAAGSSATSAPTQPATPFGVATAPTITGITPDDSQLSVAYGNSSSSNGSAISSYVATATDGTHSFTATGTSSPLLITGLDNGTVYTVAVVAVNAAGISQASVSQTGTPAGVPTAPTSVSAAAGDGQASVTFSGADANGASITGYRITVVETGATYNVTSSPATITGLTNLQSYTFTVAATNTKGTSSESVASNLVTPAAQIAASVSGVTFTGTEETGNTLTASAAIGGAPTPTVTYQWQVSSDGTNWTNISGATNSTYALTSAEAGKNVRVEVSANNGVGSGQTAASSASAAIVEALTANTPTGLNATVGTAYILNSPITGGVPTVVFTFNPSTPPNGLSFNTGNGEISGSPTSAGSYTITLTATDANGRTVTSTFTITVSAQNSNNSAPLTPNNSNNQQQSQPTCDSTCQAANSATNAQSNAQQSAIEAALAAAKAAADAAALLAAQKALASQQTVVSQAQAAAQKAAAAQASASAQAASAQAAATAAAQKAAQLANAAKTAPAATSAAAKAAVATAQAQATALAAKAAAAVKSASTAAATAVAAVAAANAAQSNLAIQITSIKVSTTVAASSAAAAKDAVSTAIAQQAAAKVAQTNATQIATAAKAAADKAAADAAKAAADKAAADAAAAKAAADAIAQQKLAEKAATDKAAADNAAVDAANKLADVAQSAVKAAEALTKATTEAEKSAAQALLDAATTEVAKAQTEVDVATKAAEAKATVLESATSAADKAQDHADVKSAEAMKAAESVAVKQATVSAAKQVVASVTQQLTVAKAAVATATANVSAAKAVAAKVSTTKANTGSAKTKSTANVIINNLKPGQRIKVTVKSK